MQFILRVNVVDAAKIVLQVSGFAFEPVGHVMREWHGDAVLPNDTRQAKMAEPVCKAFRVRIELTLKSPGDLRAPFPQLTREFIQQCVGLGQCVGR